MNGHARLCQTSFLGPVLPHIQGASIASSSKLRLRPSLDASRWRKPAARNERGERSMGRPRRAAFTSLLETHLPFLAADRSSPAFLCLVCFSAWSSQMRRSPSPSDRHPLLPFCLPSACSPRRFSLPPRRFPFPSTTRQHLPSYLRLSGASPPWMSQQSPL